MSTSLSLRCLYYPYARSVDPNMLKRAILLFDEIWFSDVAGRDQRDMLMQDQYVGSFVAEQYEDLRFAFEDMESEGTVRVHDPRPEICENDKLLTVALEEDLCDDQVWEQFSTRDLPKTWSMLRKRVPSPVFELLGSQVTSRVNSPVEAVRAGIRETRGEFPEMLRRLYYDEAVDWIIRNRADLDNLETGRSGHGTKAPSRIDEIVPPDMDLSCVFPFPVGSSLAVNQAAVVADTHGLIPLTDSSLHHALLMRKHERAQEAAQAGKTDKVNGLHPEKIRRVALAVLEEAIPDELLERLTLTQAVRYRRASEESFFRLKEYLGELSVSIESNPWDNTFESEVQKIIHGKIVPEARACRDASSEIYEKLFGSVVKKLVPMAATTLTAGSYIGLSLSQLLFMGSASAASALYPDLVDSYTSRRKQRRNSLTYLLDLKATRKDRRDRG